MPMGMLREPISSLDRAHIVIVTKCPEGIKPIDFRIVAKHLELRPYQRLYFTTFVYGSLKAFAPTGGERPLGTLTHSTHIVLVTGIASAAPLVDKLREHTGHITHLEYADHHNFTRSELKHIEQTYAAIDAADKLIITTEKDGVKLTSRKHIPKELQERLYVLPIELNFRDGDEKQFVSKVISELKNKQ